MGNGTDLRLDSWQLPSAEVPRMLEWPWWSPTVRTEPWKPASVAAVYIAGALLVSWALTVSIIGVVCAGALWFRTRARRELVQAFARSQMTIDGGGLSISDQGWVNLFPRAHVTRWWWHKQLLLVRVRHLSPTFVLDSSRLTSEDRQAIDRLWQSSPPQADLPGELLASWQRSLRSDRRLRREVRRAQGRSQLTGLVRPVLFIVAIVWLVQTWADIQSRLGGTGAIRGVANIDASFVIAGLLVANCLFGWIVYHWLWHRRTGPDQLRIGPAGLTTVEAGGCLISTIEWGAIGLLRQDDQYLYFGRRPSDPALRIVPLVALPAGTLARIRNAIDRASGRGHGDTRDLPE